MSVEIKSKIVGYSIKKVEGVSEAPVVAETPVLQDVNPLTVRIERRPEGALEAVSEKISYSDFSGKQRVYVVVSFIPVEGVLNGEKVTIERPIEFFVPSDQLTSERQWITATMRSLSLAARGGYITQALQDLRKVVWDKGPVRCGRNQYNKPIQHDSIVAAIAWSIQQILHRRGFLDEDGNQIPLEKLAQPKPTEVLAQNPSVANVLRYAETMAAVKSTVSEGLDTADKSTGPKPVGKCSECQGDMHLKDGCATCVDCGNSKCG